MKKNIVLRLLALLVLASMALAACGGGSSESSEGSATEAPAEGASTEAPVADAPSGDIVSAFKFGNSGDGAIDICELYVSPTGVNDWGTDQLQGNTLAAGGEFTLTNIPAGTYDIKGVGCDGTTEKTFSAIDIVNK
jgi:hypothetical protein